MNMLKEEWFSLEEIKKGDIMYWNVTSQCHNTFRIELKDDDRTYFTAEKKDNETTLKEISQGYAFYQGGKSLRLEVTFDNGGADIKQSIVCGSITDDRSRTVGVSYTYCFEDAEDDDYNDAYVAVMAWRKAN